MTLCHGLKEDRNVFFVSAECHPQTIEVVKTRAQALGIEVVVGDCGALGPARPTSNQDVGTLGTARPTSNQSGALGPARPTSFEFHERVFGALVQYPNTYGEVNDY